jgi:hypothetical protein
MLATSYLYYFNAELAGMCERRIRTTASGTLAIPLPKTT